MNPQSKPVTLLFNPFFYIGGARALALGLAAILAAALIASLGNTHFDGVLDTHVGEAAPLWVFFVEGLIDWLCLVLVLWIGGRIISHTAFRTIDVLGTQALARWPTIFISLIALPKAFHRFGDELLEQLKQGRIQFNTADAIIFFAIVIGMLPFLCWMVALMYRSFSVSCNVKGGKAVGMFIGALIVAEILSKLCLVLIFQHITPAHSADGVNPASASQPLFNMAEDDLAQSGAGFVELLASEDYAVAFGRFDETMKSALPQASLQNTWQALLKQVGPFQKQLGTRGEEQAGYKIVFVTCQFAHAALDLKVVFDSNKQVAGLFFVPTKGASQAN